MSRNALKRIMESSDVDPARISMLRPSMVTIVNCMNAVQKILSNPTTQQPTTISLSIQDAAEQVLETLDRESSRSTMYAVAQILQLYEENNQQPLSIGTFSRSSTLVAVLKQLLDNHPQVIQTPIVCSRSIPGGEGELMTMDLNNRDNMDTGNSSTRAICVDDEQMKSEIANMDILLVGADCVLKDQSAVVNKVGTAEIASIAFENRNSSESRRFCRVLCCTDRFKVWNDVFPPPLEEDLFEQIPVSNHIDRVLLPWDDDSQP